MNLYPGGINNSNGALISEKNGSLNINFSYSLELPDATLLTDDFTVHSSWHHESYLKYYSILECQGDRSENEGTVESMHLVDGSYTKNIIGWVYILSYQQGSWSYSGSYSKSYFDGSDSSICRGLYPTFNDGAWSADEKRQTHIYAVLGQYDNTEDVSVFEESENVEFSKAIKETLELADLTTSIEFSIHELFD